jgi:molybdopterin converting factor small subunit
LINIELKLFGEFRTYIAGMKIGESKTIRCKSGTTISEVLNLYNIPFEQVKIIIVNGRAKTFDYKLNDGDTLAIFPAIAGG